jgi:hypothetical protein
MKIKRPIKRPIAFVITIILCAFGICAFLATEPTNLQKGILLFIVFLNVLGRGLYD